MTDDQSMSERCERHHIVQAVPEPTMFRRAGAETIDPKDHPNLTDLVLQAKGGAAVSRDGQWMPHESCDGDQQRPARLQMIQCLKAAANERPFTGFHRSLNQLTAQLCNDRSVRRDSRHKGLGRAVACSRLELMLRVKNAVSYRRLYGIRLKRSRVTVPLIGDPRHGF
ncbi:hypothetical protein Pcinc_023984 [Petrolisthes cinctipes]|uniref:Uncharacterized protein n=1 Tax=Petrolisthes cinctipes TaxID=88211 RepID=A0AAE1KF06_PETCI|nr:hypothetical protein Pcinc_023984 [Petrolisthes cinctipes]